MRHRLVMITGPIAAGKSTIAAALAGRLRAAGRSVALTDLDTVAEMALPTLPDWAWAHVLHARLVGGWLATGIEVVVDEGTSTPAEVHQVLEQLPAGTSVFHVVLTADFDASLSRAQGDPSRGLSKDPTFLRSDHDKYARGFAELPRDLVLDVEQRRVEELVEVILDRI